MNQIKKPWQADSLKIALVYPNRYSAMAGLTIQTLYHLWNAFPEVICERFFMPSPELGDLRPQRHSIDSIKDEGQQNPKRRSLESNMALGCFDVIAFSLCFELDYPNVLWFLSNANIPWYQRERQSSVTNQQNNSGENLVEDYPLLICGGPAVRSNPLPLGSFFDGLFLGELEPINDRFIAALLETKKIYLDSAHDSLSSLYFDHLKGIPGFWIPSIMQPFPKMPIERVFAENLDTFPFPTAQVCPIFKESEQNSFPFGEAFYVEVNRGCPYSCRFCITGAQVKPFRNRSLANLQQILLQGREQTPFKRVVLIGSAVQAHPDFSAICEFLVDQNFEFSIPSIRVERITKELAQLFVKSGMKTITIAPETGSDSLRRTIGKSITNDAILKGVGKCLEAGLPNVKAYFLYGLPQESDDDAGAIVELAHSIADLGYGKQAVRISLNPFIPKAQTPFEACVENYLDPSMRILNDRLKLIINPLKGNRQIKIETLSLEEAYLESLLALGNAAFSDLIVDLYKWGGSSTNWYRNLKKNNEWKGKISDYFEFLVNSKFGERPWNHIVRTNSIDFLACEYGKTVKK